MDTTSTKIRYYFGNKFLEFVNKFELNKIVKGMCQRLKNYQKLRWALVNKHVLST
ncbi:MAG: hypothetical protein QXS37_04045 [Candidatus Aenigmatarchaeota archaeon]